MQQVPWNDFNNNPMFEGDTIRHPDGTTGIIVKVDAKLPNDSWRVDYGDEYLSRLCLQTNDKGQAVVIKSKSKNNV